MIPKIVRRSTSRRIFDEEDKGESTFKEDLENY